MAATRQRHSKLPPEHLPSLVRHRLALNRLRPPQGGNGGTSLVELRSLRRPPYPLPDLGSVQAKGPPPTPPQGRALAPGRERPPPALGSSCTPPGSTPLRRVRQANGARRPGLPGTAHGQQTPLRTPRRTPHPADTLLSLPLPQAPEAKGVPPTAAPTPSGLPKPLPPSPEPRSMSRPPPGTTTTRPAIDQHRANENIGTRPHQGGRWG